MDQGFWDDVLKLKDRTGWTAKDWLTEAEEQYQMSDQPAIVAALIALVKTEQEKWGTE